MQIASSNMLLETARPILITEVQTRSGRGSDHYLLPFGFLPEQEDDHRAAASAGTGPRAPRESGGLSHRRLHAGRARARRGGPAARRQAGAGGDAELRFVPTSRLAALDIPPQAEIRRLAEQSNSSLVIGDLAILKLFRRVSPGLHPEAEMGRYLTELGFAHIAPLLGEVTRVGKDGTPHVLLVLQAFIHNQGDAWSWTQNILGRAIQDAIMVIEGAPEQCADALAEVARASPRRWASGWERCTRFWRSRQTTQRLRPSRPAPKDCAQWASEACARIDEAIDLLAARRDWSDEERERVARIVALRKRLHAAAARCAKQGVGSLQHAHPRRLCTSARCWWRRAMSSSSISKASRRGRWPSGAPKQARCATWRGCCAPSTTRRNRGRRRRRRAVRDRSRAQGGYPDPLPKISEHSFLAAYREAAKGVAHCWQSVGAESALLDLFVLQKAAYEMAYEAGNRPAWLHVPLRGLEAIAARLGDEDFRWMTSPTAAC